MEDLMLKVLNNIREDTRPYIRSVLFLIIVVAGIILHRIGDAAGGWSKWLGGFLIGILIATVLLTDWSTDNFLLKQTFVATISLVFGFTISFMSLVEGTPYNPYGMHLWFGALLEGCTLVFIVKKGWETA